MKDTSGFMDNEQEEIQASSGHKLGQLIGDWFQDYFVFPVLNEVANKLNLFLDHRLQHRQIRSGKIIWNDEYGNGVDYDFVMELGGSDTQRGVPVAFLEAFWRRGARHSKDKARDDSGKLMPMRSTYPTARFLGIVASGDFTRPATELARSRDIDLFYIPKQKIVDSFKKLGMEIDYDDKSSETVKAQFAQNFLTKFGEEAKKNAAKILRETVTETVIRGYIDRVRASLSALPQEVRIIGERKSIPKVFETVDAAEDFLHRTPLEFDFSAS